MHTLKMHTIILGGFLLALSFNIIFTHIYAYWLKLNNPFFLSLYQILLASFIGRVVAHWLAKKFQ